MPKFKRYADVENKVYDPDYFWACPPDGVGYPAFIKLDGANTSIWLHEDGTLHYGSRNNDITNSGNTLRGFGEFVYANKTIFMNFFSLYPNYILYGEWLVTHTIKYPEDKLNKWYCYDVFGMKENDEEGSRWIPFADWIDKFLSAGFPKEWALYPIQNVRTVDEAKELMEKVCKEDKPFGGEPFEEGIVVKNYKYMDRYHGEQVKFKVEKEISHTPKNKEGKSFKPENIQLSDNLISKYCTDVIMEKNYQKLIDKIDGKTPRMNDFGNYIKISSPDIIKDIDTDENDCVSIRNEEVRKHFGKSLANTLRVWFIRRLEENS